MQDNDTQLVAAAQKGDRKAFGMLIESHQRKAVAVAYRLLNNTDDSLEVTQEAFVRAYRSIAQLKDQQRFSAWLMRIVVNQSLNYRRRRQRRQALSLSEPSGAERGERGLSADQLDGHTPRPDEMLAAQELSGALKDAIEQLPEKLRVPLLLFCVDKLPQKEIADIMQVSLATVKWSVFEARRRLRKRLGNMLD